LGILGAAQFVVRKAIKKRRPRNGVDESLSHFESALRQAVVIETSSEEQQFAADLELAANRAGLALDAGESQLCAIVVLRPINHLLTGDKRAIRALESLLPMAIGLKPLCGRLKCIEQLILLTLQHSG